MREETKQCYTSYEHYKSNKHSIKHKFSVGPFTTKQEAHGPHRSPENYSVQINKHIW